MVFFAVNPKIWLVLGLIVLLGLARRLWRTWRARRAARRGAAYARRPK